MTAPIQVNVTPEQAQDLAAAMARVTRAQEDAALVLRTLTHGRTPAGCTLTHVDTEKGALLFAGPDDAG
jgi:hypothetical protein